MSDSKRHLSNLHGHWGPPRTHSARCFLLHPQIPEHCRPSMEEGISLFSSLLNNKHFLIIFVHALEQQKDFAVRDRSGCWRRRAIGIPSWSHIPRAAINH